MRALLDVASTINELLDAQTHTHTHTRCMHAPTHPRTHTLHLFLHELLVVEFDVHEALNVSDTCTTKPLYGFFLLEITGHMVL
jgi:hypothetical protein